MKKKEIDIVSWDDLTPREKRLMKEKYAYLLYCENTISANESDSIAITDEDMRQFDYYRTKKTVKGLF